MIYIIENVCVKCGAAWGNIEYIDVYICKDCYIRTKLYENNIKNQSLQDNTFVVNKNGKEYVGLIIGYQHKIGDSEDKFYVYLNVSEDDFVIWYSNWMTERELVQVCDKYKINIEKLLK